FADGLLADGIKRRGARGIDQGEFVGDLNLRGYGRNAERNAKLQWNLGTHVDHVAPRGEAFGGQAEAIHTKRQILQDVVAVIGDLKAALKRVSFAEKFATRRNTGTLRIANVQMQFAAQALCTCRAHRNEAKKRHKPAGDMAVMAEREHANDPDSKITCDALAHPFRNSAFPSIGQPSFYNRKPVDLKV